MPRCTAPVSQWGGQHLSGGGETAPPKVELTSRAWRESRGGDHSRASGSASGPVLQTDTRPVCSSLTCAAAGGHVLWWPQGGTSCLLPGGSLSWGHLFWTRLVTSPETATLDMLGKMYACPKHAFNSLGPHDAEAVSISI